MRRKFSTVLDEGLFRRAKMDAARRGMKISDVVREALELYLSRKKGAPISGSVVAESWGALAWPKSKVKKLLTEEDDLLESR
jgi:hypothetical protein